MESYDPVIKPIHYNTHPSGIEAILITEHMNFCVGNAVKYLMRYQLKGKPIEDLKKAKFYLEREIARLEKLAKLEECQKSQVSLHSSP